VYCMFLCEWSGENQMRRDIPARVADWCHLEERGWRVDTMSVLITNSKENFARNRVKKWTVWNALIWSHWATVSLTYSQSNKINIRPPDSNTIIMSTDCPTVFNWRLLDFSSAFSALSHSQSQRYGSASSSHSVRN
jgi:hypothetical protein